MVPAGDAVAVTRFVGARGGSSTWPNTGHFVRIAPEVWTPAVVAAPCVALRSGLVPAAIGSAFVSSVAKPLMTPEARR
jgi:hypothetical protein